MPTEISFPATLSGKPFLSLEPDFVDSQAAERVTRGARSATTTSGAANTEVEPAPQILRRTYTYHCTSRAEIGALREFFRARKGRYEAFWFIDWQTDFIIDPHWESVLFHFYLWTKPRTTSDGTFAYGTSLYPLGPFYRYLGLARGLEWAIYRAIAVTEDNPTGSGLERIEFQGVADSGGFSVGAPFTMDNGFRPFWLRYGRFDTDSLPLEFHSSDEAIAALPILDLPLETPA